MRAGMWTSGVGKGKVSIPARPILFALAAIHIAGRLRKTSIVKAGQYQGAGSGSLTIREPMTIKSYLGAATVGK